MDRSTTRLGAALVVGAVWASACDGGAPYPAELEGHHEVTGNGFCEYTIDGHSERLLDNAPAIAIWPLDVGYADCDGDFLVETTPNPGVSCARTVSDGATLAAQLTFLEDPDDPDFRPFFSSYEPGLGTWSLREGVEYTGTLTYHPETRRLTVEYQGTGVAGSLSMYSGMGTVSCVYEATVE